MDSDREWQRDHFGYVCNQSIGITWAPEVATNTFLFWPLFVFCIHFGLISILAAVTLVLSTRHNVSTKRAVEMVKFWMHCNGFTILALTCLWVLNDWLILRMLVYFLFRVIFIIMVRQELHIMSTWLTYSAPPLEQKSDEKLEERWVGGFPVPFPVKAMVPAREPQSFDVGPDIGLGTYRGSGLSTPKCKCLNSKVAVKKKCVHLPPQ